MATGAFKIPISHPAGRDVHDTQMSQRVSKLSNLHGDNAHFLQIRSAHSLLNVGHTHSKRGLARLVMHSTSALMQAKYGDGAQGEFKMLRWALIFLVVAVIAAFLGFGGIAGTAAGIAKFLFIAFLVVAGIMLVMGLVAGKKVL